MQCIDHLRKKLYQSRIASYTLLQAYTEATGLKQIHISYDS